MHGRRFSFFSLAPLSVFGLAAALVCEPACSLIVDKDKTQCATTADCVARGGDFVRMVCGQQGVCVKQAGCDTNQDCITSNNGQPFICRKADRKCVSLSNPADYEFDGVKLAAGTCKPLYAGPNDPANDDTVWMGAIFPLTGEDQAFASDLNNAYKMAYGEIEKLANGLPPRSLGGKRRPFSFVVCDAPVEGENYVAAARYLASEIQVPAILGPPYSFQLIDMMQKVVADVPTVLISSGASSPAVAGIPAGDPRLVYRTLIADDDAAAVGAAYIKTVLEPKIRADLSMAAGDKIKVQTLYEDVKAKGEAGFANALVINGVAGLDPANADNFKRRQYLDGSSDVPKEAQGTAAASDAVAFLPHIIYVVGFGTNAGPVINKVESTWPAGAPYRPRWIVQQGVIDQNICDAFKDPANRVRIRATVGGLKTPEYDAFTQSYKSQFPTGSPSHFAAAAYNSAYMLFYGAAAAGDQTLTGPVIAKAFQKVLAPPPTQSFGVGPDKIFDVLTAISNGGTIGLNGVDGPLLFDFKKGNLLQAVQIACAPSACSGEFPLWSGSGATYDFAKNEIQGTDGCF